MGFFADFYEALTRDTTMGNVRAERRIRRAREMERGRKRPTSLLGMIGRVPYGRVSDVFPKDEETK